MDCRAEVRKKVKRVGSTNTLRLVDGVLAISQIKIYYSGTRGISHKIWNDS